MTIGKRVKTRRSSKWRLLPENFESLEQVKGKRSELIRWLEKAGGPMALDLAKRLTECKKSRRCTSGACPVCGRIWRRCLLRSLRKTVSEQPTLLRLSAIPRGGRLSPDELITFDLNRYVRTKQRALQRVLDEGVAVIGGVDISFNTTNNSDPHWQVHPYLLIFQSETEVSKARIKRALPPEPTAKRPFDFKTVQQHDFAEVISYAVKVEVYWRSSYALKGKRANTRSLKLKPAQAVSIALFLDRFPLGGRLILKGFKRHRSKRGVRVVKLGPASRHDQLAS